VAVHCLTDGDFRKAANIAPFSTGLGGTANRRTLKTVPSVTVFDRFQHRCSLTKTISLASVRQLEVEIAIGKTHLVASWKAGITEQTYCCWRKEYGGSRPLAIVLDFHTPDLPQPSKCRANVLAPPIPRGARFLHQCTLAVTIYFHTFSN
jgi:hypothetical protein